MISRLFLMFAAAYCSYGQVLLVIDFTDPATTTISAGSGLPRVAGSFTSLQITGFTDFVGAEQTFHVDFLSRGGGLPLLGSFSFNQGGAITSLHESRTEYFHAEPFLFCPGNGEPCYQYPNVYYDGNITEPPGVYGTYSTSRTSPLFSGASTVDLYSLQPHFTDRSLMPIYGSIGLPLYTQMTGPGGFSGGSVLLGYWEALAPHNTPIPEPSQIGISSTFGLISLFFGARARKCGRIRDAETIYFQPQA